MDELSSKYTINHAEGQSISKGFMNIQFAYCSAWRFHKTTYTFILFSDNLIFKFLKDHGFNVIVIVNINSIVFIYIVVKRCVGIFKLITYNLVFQIKKSIFCVLTKSNSFN